MATSSSSSSKSSGGTSWKAIFNWVAFWALAIIGLALVLAWIFSGNSISSALTLIANILAYVVVMFYAFVFASHKRGNKRLIYMITWAVASVLVVVFMILNI